MINACLMRSSSLFVVMATIVNPARRSGIDPRSPLDRNAALAADQAMV